jgi:hypothetical protein
MRARPPDLEIELTEREKVLLAQIDFDPSATSRNADSWLPIADAMQELMRSLLERNAISEARWKFFSDPGFFIGGRGCSRLDIFERNGTRGGAIFRHPHFVKYLHYFVYGPDLPKAVIDTFQQKVIDCGAPLTSGDCIAVGESARHLARSHGLEASNAAEEFYKLALDCGLDASDARLVRDAVKKLQ